MLPLLPLLTYLDAFCYPSDFACFFSCFCLSHCSSSFSLSALFKYFGIKFCARFTFCNLFWFPRLHLNVKYSQYIAIFYLATFSFPSFFLAFSWHIIFLLSTQGRGTSLLSFLLRIAEVSKGGGPFPLPLALCSSTQQPSYSSTSLSLPPSLSFPFFLFHLLSLFFYHSSFTLGSCTKPRLMQICARALHVADVKLISAKEIIIFLFFLRLIGIF